MWVQEGSLMKACRKGNKQRYFVLFNDVLVYASVIQSGQQNGLGQQQNEGLYSFHRMIQLKNVSRVKDLKDRAEVRNGFQVISSEKSFTVYAETPQIKSIWMSNINQLINGSEAGVGDEQSNHNLVAEEAPVWIPDKETKRCMICGDFFNFINRRHHCRNCGIVVCGSCSPHKRILGHISDKNVRICKFCNDYMAITEKEKEKEDTSDTTNNPVTPVSTDNQSDPDVKASRADTINRLEALFANDALGRGQGGSARILAKKTLAAQGKATSSPALSLGSPTISPAEKKKPAPPARRDSEVPPIAARRDSEVPLVAARRDSEVPPVAGSPTQLQRTVQSQHGRQQSSTGLQHELHHFHIANPRMSSQTPPVIQQQAIDQAQAQPIVQPALPQLPSRARASPATNNGGASGPLFEPVVVVPPKRPPPSRPPPPTPNQRIEVMASSPPVQLEVYDGAHTSDPINSTHPIQSPTAKPLPRVRMKASVEANILKTSSARTITEL